MSNVTQMAKQLQKYGRNGDSVLVHMQPREVKALEMVSGNRATTNPDTGLKEGFVFIPFLIALAKAGALAAGATGAAALTSKIASGGQDKQPKVDESAARQYINEQAQKAKENYRIPWMEVGPRQAPSPGHIPGVSPEQNLMPIRRPVGWISPGGQVSAPPGYAKGGTVEGDYSESNDKLMQMVNHAPPRMIQYAEGGMIPEQEEAAAVMNAVTSGNFDEATLNRFIEIFGVEALSEVMGQPQQAAAGGLLRGPGGGMDDLIPAKVQGKVPVALSGGEYVIPGDATAALGDGSNEAGGRVLDAMVARIRKTKTGKTQQPGKINLGKVLPV